MFTCWLTCIPQVLRPHSPCRSATVNTPANRRMPIASVVRQHSKKRKNTDLRLKNLWRTVRFSTWITWVKIDCFAPTYWLCFADNSSQIFEGRKNSIVIQHFDCWLNEQKAVKMRCYGLQKQNTTLSLTTRKKRKPVSSCREKWLNEKFLTSFCPFQQLFCCSSATKRQNDL